MRRHDLFVKQMKLIFDPAASPQKRSLDHRQKRRGDHLASSDDAAGHIAASDGASCSGTTTPEKARGVGGPRQKRRASSIVIFSDGGRYPSLLAAMSATIVTFNDAADGCKLVLMILDTAVSINGVTIRLTEERWEHILDRHEEFAYSDLNTILDAVEDPEYILQGYKGTLVAVVVLGRSGYLHVVYKEVNAGDGFVVTAGIRPSMDKKRILWRK